MTPMETKGPQARSAEVGPPPGGHRPSASGPEDGFARTAGAGNSAPAEGAIVIVGNPNVGKSALFNRLTGQYVTVSNYPGTTVELFRGRSSLFGGHTEIVDTPGMYSLTPITEEERVARQVLVDGRFRAVIHVVDAKNLGRMLGFTLQLSESGLPVVLALNMMDEARRIGIRIDCAELERHLGLPVVPMVSVTGEGIRELANRIRALRDVRPLTVDYGPAMEPAIRAVASHLEGPGPMSPRARALLLLQDDLDEKQRLLREKGDGPAGELLQEVARQRARLIHSPHYLLTLALREQVESIVGHAVAAPPPSSSGWQQRLDHLCMNPLTGFPLVILVLYFGFYKLVGQLGAGTLVGWLEEGLFGRYLNPWVTRATAALVPWAPLRDLICGEYGIFTLGIRYAVAIVLPIVGMFFLVFSILEDSGYLPRLAMLTDRMFKRIGLNGRAVIPMVLGFGCDTMATIVTRTLETNRERIIATFLMTLAIPCSAQLGVMLGLLSGHPAGLLLWAGFVFIVFLVAGSLAARLMPGERPSFYMELPMLRLPRPGNVFVKTYSRMVWYFREVLPLFVLASILIWLGNAVHVFQHLVDLLKPAMRAIGLPDQAAVAFLFGFFRRDYGAAGLYDLQKQHLLSGNQIAVAAITLTLFLPCVAQFLVMRKERGLKLTLIISGLVLVVAFVGGWLVNWALTALGVQL